MKLRNAWAALLAAAGLFAGSPAPVKAQVGQAVEAGFAVFFTGCILTLPDYKGVEQELAAIGLRRETAGFYEREPFAVSFDEQEQRCSCVATMLADYEADAIDWTEERLKEYLDGDVHRNEEDDRHTIWTVNLPVGRFFVAAQNIDGQLAYSSLVELPCDTETLSD